MNRQRVFTGFRGGKIPSDCSGIRMNVSFYSSHSGHSVRVESNAEGVFMYSARGIGYDPYWDLVTVSKSGTVYEYKYKFQGDFSMGEDRINLFSKTAILSIQMINFNISEVIFNDPATIVLWRDGTKTIVKCQEGDTYSKELGLAMCISKKALGNKGNFNDVFKEWAYE